MREIKFRAWDKEKKEWVDDVMIELDGTYDRYGDEDGGKDGLWKHQWGISKNIILMQYTGLKEKNGKEIYEGDILTWYGFGGYVDKPAVKVMKWDKWHYEPANAFIDIDKGILCYEIIGNIYENPELIKEVK